MRFPPETLAHPVPLLITSDDPEKHPSIMYRESVAGDLAEDLPRLCPILYLLIGRLYVVPNAPTKVSVTR